MKLRFASITFILIVALVLSTVATATNHPEPVNVDAASTLIQRTPDFTEPHSVTPALIPNREKFRALYVSIQSNLNFSKPIRRAPIRRKGRVQH